MTIAKYGFQKYDSTFSEKIKSYKQKEIDNNTGNTKEYLGEITSFDELETFINNFKTQVEQIISENKNYKINTYFNIYPGCTGGIILRFFLEFTKFNQEIEKSKNKFINVYYIGLSNFENLSEKLKNVEEKSIKQGIKKNKIIMFNNKDLKSIVSEIAEQIEKKLDIKYMNYLTIRKHRITFLLQKNTENGEYIFFKGQKLYFVINLKNYLKNNFNPLVN